MSNLSYIPAGDSAFLIKFGTTISEETHRQIMAFMNALQENKELADLIVDMVPSYADLMVYYHSENCAYQDFLSKLKEVGSNTISLQQIKTRLVEIPVCYGGIFGEDLTFVAKHNKLKEEDVIQRHSSPTYLVYMLGFTPGFSYLGGMDEKIATPRKEKPRTIIPAGSVGIAGNQTGIYPIESPGGWQLIGRTPVMLFDPASNNPVLLQAGDRIRFSPVDETEFNRIDQLVKNGKFQPTITTWEDSKS